MEQAESGEESVQKINVPVDLWSYGKRELMDGKLVIETSAATFVDKGEDRRCVSFGNKEMEECQREWQHVPRMAAYVAVFDGHDGPRAAEYCYKGLLPHILSETEECIRKHNKNHKQNGNRLVGALDGSKVESPLDAGIINAFHRAQARFARKLDPPTFEDVKQGVQATRFDNKGHLARMCCARPRRRPRGGTTALTLQIYGESEGSGETEAGRPMPCAVVANTGDCRLLTDNGTGSHKYRQVTSDHRPEDPDEHSRLVQCVRQGNALLGREARGDTLRVYPGGLAVSRSLGDLDASAAVICTPDIFRVPITGDRRTHRFVLASDGLWDVMTNAQVGKIVARKQKKETTEEAESADANGNDKEVGMILDPSKAASKLMEECLKSGGHMDDVTILIVDLSYNDNESSKDNE